MLRPHADGVLVEVWVVPGASRHEVVGEHAGALRVRTSVPPEGGKANRAVVRLVVEHLGGRSGEVVRGQSGRRKTVLVSGVTLAEARVAIEEARRSSSDRPVPVLSSPALYRSLSMARDLAKSTTDRFRKRLEEEKLRLVEVIRELEEEREEVRLTETSSDRSPDPNTAEGGSLAFEMEKELSILENTRDILLDVEEALGRIVDGTYGRCDQCGVSIPVARLDALPYTKLCVKCASMRR